MSLIQELEDADERGDEDAFYRERRRIISALRAAQEMRESPYYATRHQDARAVFRNAVDGE